MNDISWNEEIKYCECGAFGDWIALLKDAEIINITCARCGREIEPNKIKRCLNAELAKSKKRIKVLENEIEQRERVYQSDKINHRYVLDRLAKAEQQLKEKE